MKIEILKADTTDAEQLTEIAWQSKSHWNYPKEWMELWREGLKITEEIIQKNEVFKLVLANEEIVGCCVLITEEDVLWIEHLWILPNYIGHGFGKQLLETVLQETLQPIHQKIKVVSDINAEIFYQKMGFQTVDQYASKPKGRFLPIMEKVEY